MTLLRAGLFAVALMWASSCSVEQTELAQIASPDQRTIAVLVREFAGGAAGSSGYYLYFIDARGKGALGHPNLTATRCEGLSMAWADSTSLQVHYDSACSIKQFVNRWYSSTDASDPQLVKVEVVLVRTIAKD